MSEIIYPEAQNNQGFAGFSDFRIAPVTENGDKSYKIGDIVALPYVQTLGAPDTGGGGTNRIYADDSTYLEGGQQTELNRMITIAQLDVQRLALLRGGKVENGEYRRSYGTPGTTPDFACAWSHLLTNNGGYQGVKYYFARVTNVVETEITTNDGSAKVAAWNIYFTFSDRNCDGLAEARKNFTEREDMLAWLNEFNEVTAP